MMHSIHFEDNEKNCKGQIERILIAVGLHVDQTGMVKLFM